MIVIVSEPFPAIGCEATKVYSVVIDGLTVTGPPPIFTPPTPGCRFAVEASPVIDQSKFTDSPAIIVSFGALENKFTTGGIKTSTGIVRDTLPPAPVADKV